MMAAGSPMTFAPCRRHRAQFAQALQIIRKSINLDDVDSDDEVEIDMDNLDNKTCGAAIASPRQPPALACRVRGAVRGLRPDAPSGLRLNCPCMPPCVLSSQSMETARVRVQELAEKVGAGHGAPLLPLRRLSHRGHLTYSAVHNSAVAPHPACASGL